MDIKKIIVLIAASIVFVISFVCVIYKIATRKVELSLEEITKDYEMYDVDATVYTDYLDYKHDLYKIEKVNNKFSDYIFKSDFEKYNVVVIKTRINECSETIDNIKFENYRNFYIVKFDLKDKCGVCAFSDVVLVKKVDKNINDVLLYKKMINKETCDPLIDY